MISGQANGVYRHRVLHQKVFRSAELVWFVWLADALVDALDGGLVEAGIVDAAYDGLVVGVVDVGGGLEGLHVVARGRFRRHLKMVGDRGFRRVASSLYSGNLISRIVFFLLRGVDETPFKPFPATNPKDRFKMLR